MIYVVFDIETTGLDTANDRIVEIGAVKVENDEIIDTFSYLMNPLVPIPPHVSAINNITNEMLETAEYSGVILQRFASFIEDATFLVGHNAKRFDAPFIASEFKRHMVKYKAFYVRDTVFLASTKLGRKSRHSLKALCSYYGIINTDAHRALSDALATYEVYKRLVKE